MGNLALVRHIGESIMVGDDVEITLVEMHPPGRAKITVNAPEYKW